MARRRRSRSKSRQVQKALTKIKPIWIIKAILYALGIYSFFYCQQEYATTLISFNKIITTGLIAGLVASLIIERNIKYYLFSVILLGSLSLGVLFKLNRSFVHAKEEKITARILGKSTHSSKTDHSTVTVEYDDFSRDISIDGIQDYLVAPAHFIVLTVRKGGLGYYIITYRELLKQ